MKAIVAIIACTIFHPCFSQNLPSLLTGKNLNCTFSITAYDSAAKEWGIAVATNNIYVGNSTVYVRPGVGAFSVIAETEPAYAIDGFEQLLAGHPIRDAIESTRKNDSDSHLRQVAGIDKNGNTYAFTGESWKYEKGYAGAEYGPNCVAIGNQLAPEVLKRICVVFEKTQGALATRLLAALTAGQAAGGQITGKQSAALVVKGSNNDWFNNIDLRIDDSRNPFGDLIRLLHYHYGRIRLNQSIFAIRAGNLSRGKQLLIEGDSLVRGWNGIQGKVAEAWLLLGDNHKAITTIHAALKANPRWKENLPAFYLLHNDPEMQIYFHNEPMSEKDWIAAISMLDELGRPNAMDSCCRTALHRYPQSSYLHYLLAKSLLAQHQTTPALTALHQALQLDPDNREAARLLSAAR
jgi:uncharacterized Ntn-hydrolase superfamily protein